MMKPGPPDGGTRVGSTVFSDPVSREKPFCLELVAGLEASWRQSRVFMLKGTALRVGRVQAPPVGADGDMAPNDIVLPAESVSRRHAVLQFRESMWWCSDRGSAGGTSINNVKLDANTRELPITPGDRIQVGPRVTLVCRGEADGRPLVASELPAPLARLESALKTSPDRVKRLQTIFLEFDRVLRFLVACSLATLRQLAEQDRALCERLVSPLCRSDIADGRNLSMGTWLQLSSALSALVPSDAPGTYPKIASAIAGEMAALEPVVKLRNTTAHRWVPSEAELTDAESEVDRPITALLRACAPFSSMRLMSVARTENLVEGCRYDVYLLKGNENPSHLTFDCNARMLHRWCYLVDLLEDPGCERPLLLAPLLAAGDNQGGVKLLVAEQLDLGPRTAKVTLKVTDTKEAKESLPIPWTRDIAGLYEAIQARGR